MALIFYTNPMSRGQIARWALHEVGADYEQRLLSYGEGMKSADYLKINPMGKVPAIDHDGKIVTEAAAICTYLGVAFPKAGLAPRDEEQAAFFRAIFFASGPVEAAVTNRSLGFEMPDDPQKRGMAGYGSYDQAVDMLEYLVSQGDYICGQRFTIADVYVGSQVDWGLQFGTLPKRDAFSAYAERVRDREAYRAAKAIDMKLIEDAQAEGT